MAERWIVSDLHFDHYNIIRYCGRPFENVSEMNEYLLTAFNETVKPPDRVYNLGDLTMRRGKKNLPWLKDLVKKFNGHNVLYLGNHDHFDAKEYLEAGFENIRATWRDDLNIVYSHIPIHPESMGSAIANVHGHTHDAPDEDPVVNESWRDDGTETVKLERVIRPYLNVSIERTDYKPIHIDEVLARINRNRERFEKELNERKGFTVRK